MSNQLKFGIAADKDYKMSITAPRNVLTEVLRSKPLEAARKKIGTSPIFTQRIQEDGTVAMFFNAKRIGNLKMASKENNLEYANLFITQLVRLAGEDRIEHDPLIALTSYSPAQGSGEFNFVAEITKPVDTKEILGFKVGSCMMRMAHQLRLIPGISGPERYERRIQGDIDLGGEGVSLQIGVHSIVSTHAAEWRPEEHRFELTGNNIEVGEQPLIFLAGAVALAHADELVIP